MAPDGQSGQESGSTLEVVEQIIEHVHTIAELRELTAYATNRFPICATVIGGPQDAHDRDDKLRRLGNAEHRLERLVKALVDGAHRSTVRSHLDGLEGFADRIRKYARMGSQKTFDTMTPTPEEQQRASGEVLQTLEKLRAALAPLETGAPDRAAVDTHEPADNLKALADSGGPGQDEDGVPELKSFQAMALAAWVRAVKANGPDATMADHYEWLKSNPVDDYPLPSLDTWSRYVRSARKIANLPGRNSPRGGRTGGSIRRPEEI